MGRSRLNEQIKSKWNRYQREGADFKIMFGLCFVFAAFQAIIVVNASLFGEFSSKLAELDSGFSRGGPTFGLLQDYEDLLTDVIGSSLQLQHENATLSEDEQKLLLPKIYYKKGLIDLFLGKESKAIEDFRNCLVHDESMNIAKSRLFKLYLAHGRYKDIAELKESQYTVPKYKAFMESNVEVQQLMKDAEAVQRKIQEAELLVKQKNYAECINSVSSALGISPSNAQLYKTRIACTIKAALHNQKQKPTAGEAGQNVPETSLRQDLASYLIPDYLSLELLTPLVVENYITAASLYLFGLDEYENGAKHIRKGLHYDMDDAELKKFTLFFKRNEKLLKLLKRFKNLNSWLFDKEEIANEHVDINYLQKTDYEQLLELLFNTKPTIPARDVRKHYGGKEFANNYEYFTHLATEFNNKLFNTHESGWKAKLGFSTNTAPKHLLINGFTLDLDKFACESYLALKQAKQAKPYCGRVLETEKQNKDIENNYISSFLPAMVFDIQQFLKNKDLDKLREIYEMFHNNQNLQHFDLFKKLYSKIEKLLTQQQQQDQQQRFYQQQQQHQQQRQYQQRPRQSAPKNDYYKTLGLAKDADERDIKKAYRNLVKKYHPDKYKGDDAEDKMAKINTAYEVLSNPELRARYDQGDDPNDQTGGGNQGGFGNAGGAAFNPFGNGQFHFDFGGAGSQFGGFDFGGFGGGPRKAKTGRKKSKRGH